MDSEQPPQAAQKRGFFYGLCSDENGVPDEANMAFLIAFFVIIIGAVYNAYKVHHFDMLAFAGGVGALIPIYRVSRGDLRRP